MPRTFHLDPSVTALLPELRVGVIIASGFDNRRSGEQSAALLAQAAEQVRQRVGDAEIPALPEIAPWREAYRAFGVKPSKYRSSIEGLYRSAVAGSVRSINPLVDLYNVVSLQAGSPCGGEDLAALDGDIHLTRATGTESFTPLGMDGRSAADPRRNHLSRSNRRVLPLPELARSRPHETDRRNNERHPLHGIARPRPD